MKKNLIRKIKCLLCGVLLIVPLFPFRIYADTISSTNVVGYSVYYEQESIDGYTSAQTSYYNYVGNFHFVFEFDESYLGYFTIQAYVDSYHYYFGANPPTYGIKRVYASGTYYINGNRCEIVVPAVLTSSRSYGFLDSNSTIHENPVISYNYNINSSNVTTMASLSTLDDVVNVLTDISNYVSIDVMDELLNIVSNTNIGNKYLETISKIRQYYFPSESLGPIMRFLYGKDFNSGDFAIHDFPGIDRWIYPLFECNYPESYFYIFRQTIYKNKPIDIVFWINSSRSATTFWNDFSINDTTNFQVDLVERLETAQIFLDDNSYTATSFALYHLKVSYIGSGSGSTNFRLQTTINPIYIIPIFCGISDNASTEFCLRYNMENQVIRNINIIANGTSASSSSSSDLEDSADDIIQNSSTMFQFENTQNQNMNNALQNINTNFDIGSFGSSFLSSANWVRTQFDNITNSTPFGSILSFSLLLGLALLIIGKVYK